MGCSNFEILFGFDMESDVGSWTPFHEGLRQATPLLLELFGAHQITGTFYFVGASAREVPEAVLAVKSAGHEIGSHSLFHETVGEPIFPIPGMVPLLPHEIEPRLELNTRWIEEVSGVRPLSFRAPRLFGSSQVCRSLEKLGYLSDASYPLYHFRERLEPYHPHSEDWTEPGEMRLVEIPNFADLTIPSTDPYGRDRDQWPLFRTESAAVLLERIDRHLEYLAGRRVQRRVLSFYFHPWEFWPMPQDWISFGEGEVRPNHFIVENCGEYALEQLDLLILGLKSRGGNFKTAVDIARATIASVDLPLGIRA